jgi:hypothetical protein
MSNIPITVAVAVANVAAAAMVVPEIVEFNGHALERNSISQYNVTIEAVFTEFRTVQLWSIPRLIMKLSSLHKTHMRHGKSMACIHKLLNNHCWRFIEKLPVHLPLQHQELYLCWQSCFTRVNASFQWHSIFRGHLQCLFLFLVWQSEIIL